MTDKTYNGWTNYVTWRVNLEVFDGFDPDGIYQTAEDVKAYVDDAILCWADGIAAEWARAFLENVDWQEIADHINEAYELTDPDADEDQDEE